MKQIVATLIYTFVVTAIQNEDKEALKVFDAFIEHLQQAIAAYRMQGPVESEGRKEYDTHLEKARGMIKDLDPNPVIDDGIYVDVVVRGGLGVVPSMVKDKEVDPLEYAIHELGNTIVPLHGQIRKLIRASRQTHYLDRAKVNESIQRLEALKDHLISLYLKENNAT